MPILPNLLTQPYLPSIPIFLEYSHILQTKTITTDNTAHTHTISAIEVMLITIIVPPSQPKSNWSARRNRPIELATTGSTHESRPANYPIPQYAFSPHYTHSRFQFNMQYPIRPHSTAPPSIHAMHPPAVSHSLSRIQQYAWQVHVTQGNA